MGAGFVFVVYFTDALRLDWMASYAEVGDGLKHHMRSLQWCMQYDLKKCDHQDDHHQLLIFPYLPDCRLHITVSMPSICIKSQGSAHVI